MYVCILSIYIITDKLACAYIHTCRQADRQTEYTYWFHPLYTYTLHACTGSLYMPIIDMLDLLKLGRCEGS